MLLNAAHLSSTLKTTGVPPSDVKQQNSEQISTKEILSPLEPQEPRGGWESSGATVVGDWGLELGVGFG